MKRPRGLIASDDKQADQRTSFTQTSLLYSSTFSCGHQRQGSEEPSGGSVGRDLVGLFSHGRPLESSFEQNKANRQHKRGWFGLGDYLLTAAIGKAKASTSSVTPFGHEKDLFRAADCTPIDDDSDWILVGGLNTDRNHHSTKQPCQMVLDSTDVDLIRASWVPVRKDPVGSGVLLFRGLFTKFPQYLKFFPAFIDLDLENMRENKRLIRHAVKVIETVTFVADSAGDESKADQLNAALLGLVRSHLQRDIGLAEFRNLGIVLIDFICDVNQRGGPTSIQDGCTKQVEPLKGDDSETMTSALDKVRAPSSPSSSSELDGCMQIGKTTVNNNLSKNFTSADTNALVSAWTRLYSSILDLVKLEERNNLRA